MNKTELVAAIAEKAGLSKKDADAALAAFVATVEETLKKGDKIITAGGIYGVVKEIKETTLLIEVDGNVTLRIDKNMVVGDNSQLQK